MRAVQVILSIVGGMAALVGTGDLMQMNPPPMAGFSVLGGLMLVGLAALIEGGLRIIAELRRRP